MMLTQVYSNMLFVIMDDAPTCMSYRIVIKRIIHVY